MIPDHKLLHGVLTLYEQIKYLNRQTNSRTHIKILIHKMLHGEGKIIGYPKKIKVNSDDNLFVFQCPCGINYLDYKFVEMGPWRGVYGTIGK